MQSNLAYQFEEEQPEELIGSKPMMMAPASSNHVFIAGSIYYIFKNYLKGKKCTPIADGMMVYLTKSDHFVPDMMVVCDRDKIKPDGVHGAPDLVVEILSPSTAKNDRTYKKDAYAKSGVREYWIVSPSEKIVEVYQNSGSEFTTPDVYTVYPDWMLDKMTEEERAALVTHFKCSLFDDLEITLEDIFEGLL